MIEIIVNGQSLTTAARTVEELSREVAPHPATLLIEHNTEALTRDQWPQRLLAPGDRIEILRIAAGG
ncbi:MAG: hypothetical protein Fur0032_04890 [Terrimicrobiaceae bacterium]